jgi:hypothetical protein
MAQTVELNLRIPSLRLPREGSKDAQTITNSEVRFIKRVEFDTIPKPGAILTVAVGPDLTVDCEVVRAEWHDDANMFVVACRYAKRSISPAEYRALLESTDWEQRALL